MQALSSGTKLLVTGTDSSLGYHPDYLQRVDHIMDL